MELIPVVDLMGGAVVRGVRGDRARYRPIESALCGGSDPATVACKLVSHCAAATLYVADLDAIMRSSPHWTALEALLAALPPTVTLWLDAGFGSADAAVAMRHRLGPRVLPVFGTESLASRAAAADCLALPGAVLSLDSRHGRPVDPAGLHDAPGLWPARVIAMTLDQVGADAGPDLAAIARLRATKQGLCPYGAGGIRDGADLDAARAAGAAGWLVASALHDGRIAARG
ncbi:HisA/HisF-related TIM barrel protein [Derxia gummosa]|uniref:HisA/HisF-related TIM barrel protein n=1 Tax=Derxia gummosa DSM 723 TaxID=1121388 RepID=A0A8B6X385_9BURK|nr:HisA/HisF-related TIM barrel protein [Derxia gummosa]